MADSGDHKRQDLSPSFRPASKKIRLRPQVLEQPADHIPTNSKKSLKRSTAMGSKSNEQAVRDQSPDHTTTARESLESAPIKASIIPAERAERDRTTSKPSINDMFSPENVPLPEPDPAIDTSIANLANDSEGSSGSCETITLRQDGSGKTTSVKPKKHPISKPNALNFLDSDSPQVTPESIQRTVKESSKPSPETPKNTSPSAHSTSSASSGFREDVFDVFNDHETDRSTSPEHSIDEDPRTRAFGEAGPRTAKTNKGRKRNYGTPEMPRGNAQYPHVVPPEELTPRAPNQQFFKRLPRAEKLPLTGYELLASRLSSLSADRSGQLRPIYRRFEALNHRMLLHLQDEISELEEKLHRLDTADTQNRRLPNGILPASRRAEFGSGGEFQWHKADILGQIAWKLDQYNRVLSSFRETLSLPPPTMPAISQYRGFLANYTPISEAETQFLDATDDLVCLSYSDDDETIADEDVVTPVSRSDITDFHSRRRVSILSQSDTSRQLDERNTPPSDPERVPLEQQHTTDKYLLMHLSVAMAAAVILPILTFLVIPGFIGRMSVVALVGTGILGALVQGSWVKFQATQEFCLSVGLYGCVMAVLAGMVN